MELVRDDLVQFQRKPRIPVRVVLNSMTLTVFQSDHYETAVFSVNLEALRISEF